MLHQGQGVQDDCGPGNVLKVLKMSWKTRNYLRESRGKSELSVAYIIGWSYVRACMGEVGVQSALTCLYAVLDAMQLGL